MKYKQKDARNGKTVLRIPGENCLISNWHSSRAATGISFFRVLREDDEYSINWRNNIVAVIKKI